MSNRSAFTSVPTFAQGLLAMQRMSEDDTHAAAGAAMASPRSIDSARA